MEAIVKKARRMRDLKNRIDKRKEQMKELQAEYDKIRNNEIPDMLDDAELDSLVVKGVGRVYGFPMLSCSALGDDPSEKAASREALHRWLKSRRAGSLIVPTVNSSTLTAYLKEQIENGMSLEEVENFLKVAAWTQARIQRV